MVAMQVRPASDSSSAQRSGPGGTHEGFPMKLRLRGFAAFAVLRAVRRLPTGAFAASPATDLSRGPR